MADPQIEYQQRLDTRRGVLQRLTQVERVAGNLRVVVFLGGLVLAVLVVLPPQLPWWWLAALVITFVGVSAWHRRVSWAMHRAARAAAYYERGLARIGGAWVGSGDPGTRYLSEAHLNAQDLDLFGRGSLFQLLNTARTRNGQDTLASWLLSPAEIPEICSRQEAVRELATRLDLREDLSLLGATAHTDVDLDGLGRWGEARPVLTSLSLRLLAIPLALINSAAVIAYLAYGVPLLFVFPAFLLGGAYALLLRDRVRTVLKDVEKRAQDLSLLSGVLGRIEGEEFKAARLQELHRALSRAGRPPSQMIRKLVGLIELLDWYRNAYFAPIGAAWLWNTQLAFAVESWRGRAGPAIAGWLRAVGEFEALAALATYSFENPSDPFPTLLTGEPCFDGHDLGHPLLPRDRCIRNDLKLGGEVRLLIMSGSNMSGKSTMLRTVGINTVLALSGAPVRASVLRLTPLRIGATLRIQDSLQEGKSRFYAEITRIKQLFELAGETRPLFFLLDELLAGTNSHDRRVGAEGIVRGLLDKGAIGILTTHDLALTELATVFGGHAANVHFEDVLQNGEVHFDYRMRSGVVQHSNALALMRAVGLQVGGDS
jgi:hypothetical protein